jgi:hypothetical protein
MMQPHRITPINDNLRRKIAAHLVTNYHNEGAPTVQQMLAFIPNEVDDWKKIKLLDRDEVIRTATLINDGEKHHRDNTFVKVSLPDVHDLLSVIFMTHSMSRRLISMLIGEMHR